MYQVHFVFGNGVDIQKAAKPAFQSFKLTVDRTHVKTANGQSVKFVNYARFQVWKNSSYSVQGFPSYMLCSSDGNIYYGS